MLLPPKKAGFEMNIRKSNTRSRRSTISSRCRVLKARRLFGYFERLEPRMMLAASSIDGRPYVELGPSDNVALDQPRVTVQLIESSIPPGVDPSTNPQYVVGPEIFSEWLLDTGANTTLTFESAIDEMNSVPPVYQTQGVFAELGVGGTQLFDTSVAYRFDYAGFDGVRQTLLNTRIISDETRDLSIFGPWGIHGMPGMADQYTTLDFTGWIEPELEDLYMKTTFPTSLPNSSHRYTFNVNNNVNFDVEDGVVSGAPPIWADVPFLDVQVKNNDLVSGGNFLFDTGAQVSIISTNMGIELGLDTNNDGILNEHDAQFARTEVVGGVGGSVTVPVFLLDEVHIQTEQGADLVWTDLQWLVFDIAEGIDGVFGFDNLTSGWIESFFGFGAPGFVYNAHLDFQNWNATGDGQIHIDLNPVLDSVVDPNGPGIVINESGGSTLVSEMGHTDTYSVQLSQQPGSNVTINLIPSSSVTAWRQGFPSQQSLTFTPSNWNQPQVVQVGAVNDDVEQSFYRGNIRHTATSTDPAFQGIGLPRVTVNIIDNDYPAVMVLRTNGETLVSEGGLTDTYQLVLSYPPTSNVEVRFEHQGDQVLVTNLQNGSNKVTFTPANWSTPQSVRVEAVDDSVAEGLHRGWITHSVVSSDINYESAFAIWEIAYIQDNDTAAPAPTIQDVIVASSQWNAATIDLVDGGGVGTGNGLGYSLFGSHQLNNLSWHNLDRIYVRFSDNVGAAFTANNLALVGSNTSSYMSLASLAYGVAGPNVGSIQLSQPLDADALILAISENVENGSGVSLDGDWVNGSSNPSGNGTPGGQFNFRIDVLPGDFSNNNIVNFADIGTARNFVGQNVTSAELTKYDYDGSGTITFADLGQIRAMVGGDLPDPPSPPDFPPGIPLVSPSTADGLIGRIGFVQSIERFEIALKNLGIQDEKAQSLPLLQWTKGQRPIKPLDGTSQAASSVPLIQPQHAGRQPEVHSDERQRAMEAVLHEDHDLIDVLVLASQAVGNPAVASHEVRAVELRRVSQPHESGSEEHAIKLLSEDRKS